MTAASTVSVGKPLKRRQGFLSMIQSLQSSLFVRLVFREGARPIGSHSVLCLPDQLADFAPSNKLYVIFLEQLAKNVAGYKVEIALAPFSAPIRMAGGHSLHFFIGKRQMHDHVRNTR